MQELIISRHGESTFSQHHTADGDPAGQVALTEAGREQAAHLGQELREATIDLCVTSEFLRTRETAGIALQGREIPRLIDPDLNDVRYGSFQGKPIDQYHDWLREHGLTAIPPDGESRVHIAARAVQALHRALQHPENTILVVTHEMIIDDLQDATHGEVPDVSAPHIPYATPFRFSREEVQHALEVLESWLKKME